MEKQEVDDGAARKRIRLKMYFVLYCADKQNGLSFWKG